MKIYQNFIGNFFSKYDTNNCRFFRILQIIKNLYENEKKEKNPIVNYNIIRKQLENVD